MAWLKGLFGRAPSPVDAPAPDATASTADDWKSRGNTALQQWNLAEAARCYEQGVQAAPSDPTLRLNLGFVLLEQGRFDEAARRVDEALALRRPADDFAHEAHYFLARAHAGRQRWADAIEAAEEALRLRPEFGEARQELRNASFAHFAQLFGDRRFAEALAEAQRLQARLGPDAAVLGNIAAAQGRLGRPDLALAALEEALRLDPHNRGLIVNHTAVLHLAGRVREAADAAREGLRLYPDDADLHWNLAVNLLLLGDFEAGWAEHEWRSGRVTALQQPRWRGESLEGRSILLYGEQGFGDIIQFVRFVPDVARRAHTVHLRMLRPVESLDIDLPANCKVVRVGEDVPRTDFECPLMSLPAVLGTTQATIPAQVPYVHADRDAARRWRDRLGDASLNVGITWSGNPNNLDDMNRSMPLATLLRAAVLGCRFVVVQTQLREADRATLAVHPEVLDVSAELQSFAGTAALLDALDLVLTVDTSVAHLAGAMARPLWIMLPWLPDWRWMLDRADSPWYPSARLYRQSKAKDWDGVTARVRADLADLVSARVRL